MSRSTVSFNVELCCESIEPSQTISVSFPSLPDQFDEIKDEVEEKCSIPSFVQTIWIQGNRIEPSPSNTPASFYLQSGDMLKITYPTKCDCKSVKKTVRWLSECMDIVNKMKKSEKREDVIALYEENEATLNDYLQMLVLKEYLFVSGGGSNEKMNACYFDHLDGVVILVRLHKEMSLLRRKDLSAELSILCRYLESCYCEALGTFASDTELRRRVTDCGGLERCLATFMAYPVDDLKHAHMFDSGLFAVCK